MYLDIWEAGTLGAIEIFLLKKKNIQLLLKRLFQFWKIRKKKVFLEKNYKKKKM